MSLCRRQGRRAGSGKVLSLCCRNPIPHGSHAIVGLVTAVTEAHTTRTVQVGLVGTYGGRGLGPGDGGLASVGRCPVWSCVPGPGWGGVLVGVSTWAPSLFLYSVGAPGKRVGDREYAWPQGRQEGARPLVPGARTGDRQLEKISSPARRRICDWRRAVQAEVTIGLLLEN